MVILIQDDETRTMSTSDIHPSATTTHSTMQLYDYVIIGAGPTGLACAWLLTKKGYKCIIVEKANTIGGCHRAMRVHTQQRKSASDGTNTRKCMSGYYAIHGPRVYCNTYVHMNRFHSELNMYLYERDLDTTFPLAFHNLFTQMHLDIRELILGARTFSMRELVLLSHLMFHGSVIGMDPLNRRQPAERSADQISMEEWMRYHQFSDLAKQYIDRLCRSADGTASDRTPMSKFASIPSKGNVYQLKRATDVGMFSHYHSAFKSAGIPIITNVNAGIRIHSRDSRDLIFSVFDRNRDSHSSYSLDVSDDHRSNQYLCKRVICAVPPAALQSVLPVHIPERWIAEHSYISYFSFMFHWNYVIEGLGDGVGITPTDYDLMYIIQSHYIKDESPTMLCVLISNAHNRSSYNNKTALECSADELVSETFRQLQIILPTLPRYDVAIYANGPSDFPAYVDSSRDQQHCGPTLKVPIHMDDPTGHSHDVSKLIFTVGTHNGTSTYRFTSMESAIESAYHFVDKYC